MRISVVVPSYGRHQSLRECLAALSAQARAADEVIVVTRADDRDTRVVVSEVDAEEGLAVREEVVDGMGLVCALRAGSNAATGDVVAITDDDAAPRRDWLQRLQAWYEDPRVTGVGGRDVLANAPEECLATEVGEVQWHGRVIGNHHLGTGAPRDVDVLKGVNMSFRRDPLVRCGFDERLRGIGAQVHNELNLCLTLRRSGARLVYDPAVLVDHMPAERPSGDARSMPASWELTDAVHNETLALLEYLPPHRRAVFLAWGILIGRQRGPGLCQVLLVALRGDPTHAWRNLVGSLRGRWAGWRTFRSRRR